MDDQFYYTYVLNCNDGRLYIGSTKDLVRRLMEHQSGHVDSTRHRRPVVLMYYEACKNKKSTIERENYFKTGYGRGFLKKRLQKAPT